LVISVGGEGLGLLGGDSSVTFDEFGHDTTSGLNTSGERNNIEEEQVLNSLGLVTIENGSLDGSTVSDGLIGVDSLVKSFTVEEVRKHFLDLRDTGGTTNEHNFVNLTLGEIRILKNVFKWGHALLEISIAKFLKLSTGEIVRVIFTFSEGFTEDLSLERARKDTFGLFASSAETTESTVVALNVDAGLLLEISDAEIYNTVVEIFTT